VIKYASKPRGRSLAPILGTVGEDKWRLGYLKYLARRYNKLREGEITKSGEAFRHAFIWVRYAQEMKFTVSETPIELFERGAAFLKGRVDGTRLGKILRAKGQKRYREFSEFKQEGEGNQEDEGIARQNEVLANRKLEIEVRRLEEEERLHGVIEKMIELEGVVKREHNIINVSIPEEEYVRLLGETPETIRKAWRARQAAMPVSGVRGRGRSRFA
jgi:nucleotide-binding universal stress UspA family protein